MTINELFANLYELVYYTSPFSNDIYNESLYTSLGISNLLISLFLVISFYFIINRPSFSNTFHWFIILVINAIIAFIIGVSIPKTVFEAISLEYTFSEYIQFSMVHTLISTFFFLIWTYLLKWWYGNAKGTPKLFFGKF